MMDGGNSDGPAHHNSDLSSCLRIGEVFARHYYNVLNSSPKLMHKFYREESIVIRPELDGALTTVTTTDAINEYFLSNELKDSLMHFENVHTLPSLAGGLLIVVTGFFTMPDTVKQRYTQSFFLATQETGGYFVLNDVLRYVREIPSAGTNGAIGYHSNGNTQVAHSAADELETTSVKESMDPELQSAQIPEAASAPPAKMSYASIMKTKNESTQPAPITKPKPRPKPTIKRAENVDNSSHVPAGINNVTHSNNNGNARDSRVLPSRGGYGDNFKGRGAGFQNNGNNRDANNYRDGNNMRNESRNQNEYSGRGRGLQGNDYRQNRNDYRQNRDGYNQNRDGGYKPNKEGGRQNGSGYHQPRPVQNENGNGRPGRFNGPKQPTKKKGMDAAASSSLSRKGKQEADEMAKEQAVHAEMNKVLGQAMESDAFLSKKTKALLDAAMRSMLEKKNQHSIETLPRFEIDMHCTLEELYNFIEERRFRYQMVASLQMFNEVVATPPNIHNTHQMVEVMKKLEDGKRKISVMQFIINEHDNYVGAFRPTPPGNPYQPDGFFVFKNMVNKLPEFLGTLLETGHFESYSTTTQVELRPGFLELMVQRLQESFTAKNYMKLITARNPYVEAPMILFGECQRSAEVLEAVRGSEDGPFRLITDVLDTSEAARVSHVSLALDTLFHNWSTLSKVGLWLFIAIIEFDEGLKDALRSFMEFRMQMRRCINKMSGKGPSRVDVKLYDDDGVFNLKQLLGRYLTLVKFEEALVVRCIMRTRRKFLGTYDGFALSEANIRLQHLWDTCDDDESDDEEVIENRPYRSDKIEWERWLSFRERKLRLQDEFVK